MKCLTPALSLGQTYTANIAERHNNGNENNNKGLEIIDLHIDKIANIPFNCHQHWIVY